MFMNCENCGKSFRYYPSEVGRARFCSKPCRFALEHRDVTETIPCKVCGKEYTTYKVGSDRRATCSPECGKRAQRKEGRSTKVSIACRCCGKLFEVFPSRAGTIKYCSPTCKIQGMVATLTGSIRSSQIVECAYCGKPMKQYRSRTDRRPFCNGKCYHAWDSEYKRTPAMHQVLMQRMLDQGGKPSGVEMAVAEWLAQHGIQFAQQVQVKHFLVDFQVGSTLIEVNGCFWHACAEHFPMLKQPHQQKRIVRDKRLRTYCARRDIPLLTIWEHDVRAGNFTALASLLS